MAALRGREVEAVEQAADLGRVVVRDRRLEVLAYGKRLCELPAQPAQEGHGRRVRHLDEATPSARHALVLVAGRRRTAAGLDSIAGPLAHRAEQGTFNPKGQVRVLHGPS